MKRLFLLHILACVCSFSWITLYGQKDSYTIKVNINGIKDTACYIASYYGDGNKKYLQDTARADSKGNIIFSKKKLLPTGIYMIITPAHKYFEFIINKEQTLSMETDTADFIKNMNIKGSAENKLFYEYLNFANVKQKEMEPLMKVLKKTNNKDSIKFFKEQLKVIEDAVKDYKLKFIIEHPETFVAKVFKTSQENENLPEPPLLPDGKRDSAFVYRYYKLHFFDNVDFADERLLRTPVFHNKLEQYITQVVIQIPDSVNKEADMLIEKSRSNKEIFKYVVWYITNWSETCSIMGMDAVFVHIIEKYYATNQAYWVNPTQLQKIVDRAKQLKYSLLGTKSANLIMSDNNGKIQSLHDIKAKYLILYFWDTDCGHCKTETPKLLDYYHKIKSNNVEVFAVCISSNLKEWEKYINDNNLDWINVADTINQNFKYIFDIYSTPVIYLLDADKRIIAKRLSIEQLQEFINRLLKKDIQEIKQD